MRAPMPGLVKLVRAGKGDAVMKGQPLLILEAMKMEHTIAASHDGVIAEIVIEGAQVTDGTVLVKLSKRLEMKPTIVMPPIGMTCGSPLSEAVGTALRDQGPGSRGQTY